MPEFLVADREVVVSDVAAHLNDLLGKDPSDSQRRAWPRSLAMLRDSLEFAGRVHAGVRAWHVVLEYELPLEGGRRPDALILAGRTLFVLEFKGAAGTSLANLDQVAAYAHDIRDYHSESRDLEIVPVLVSSANVVQRRTLPSIEGAGTPEQLAELLADDHGKPSSQGADRSDRFQGGRARAASRPRCYTKNLRWRATAAASGGGTAFATWSGWSARGPQKK